MTKSLAYQVLENFQNHVIVEFERLKQGALVERDPTSLVVIENGVDPPYYMAPRKDQQEKQPDKGRSKMPMPDEPKIEVELSIVYDPTTQMAEVRMHQDGSNDYLGEQFYGNATREKVLDVVLTNLTEMLKKIEDGC